jgi:hypothetical protein
MKSIIKNLFLLLIALLATGLTCFVAAQDVDKRLDEAQSAYNAGNLEAARFALQQAMNEVDLAIGREILKLMPSKMGNLGYKESDDQVGSASMGYAGLYVNRSYTSDENASVNVQVIADSPLLAGINTILSLPLFGNDPNQKRIRVGNYRSLLQKSEGSDGQVSWDIQVPFGSSLLTINYKGIPEENAVVEMANTLPVEQISRLVQ